MKSIFEAKNKFPKEEDAHTKHVNFLDEKEKMDKQRPAAKDIDPHLEIKVTDGFRPSKEASVGVSGKTGPECGIKVTCDLPELPTVANQLKTKAKAGEDGRVVPLGSGCHFGGDTGTPKGAVPVKLAGTTSGELTVKSEEKLKQSIPTTGIAGATRTGDGTAKIAGVPPIEPPLGGKTAKEKLAELEKRMLGSMPKSTEDAISQLDKIVERLQKQNKERLEGVKGVAGFPSDHKTMERLQKLVENALEKYVNSLETDASQSDLKEENDRLWQAHFLLIDQIKQLRAENEELRGAK